MNWGDALGIVTAILGAATLAATIRWAKPSADFAREEIRRRSYDDTLAELRLRKWLRDLGEMLYGAAAGTRGPNTSVSTVPISANEWAAMEELATAAGRLPEMLLLKGAVSQLASSAPMYFPVSPEDRATYADRLEICESSVRRILEIPGGEAYPPYAEYAQRFLEQRIPVKLHVR
jgi:hypothetical protein